jgi:hypothetical protein
MFLNQTVQSSTSIGFVLSIWKQRRSLLLLGIGLSIAQFTLFKLLYPFPDFFSDSYSYIFAAAAHLDINIWPIGYSKFLAAFHTLSYSDTALVACQYFLIQFASLYFYFSILYFYHPTKITEKVLFLFLFLNPLNLYIGNTINSDALFIALSLLWITELIWIFNRSSVYRMVSHGILLSACFTVRNNAYYYPLVSAITILTLHKPFRLKIIGLSLPLIAIALFVIHTENASVRLTGTRQFSLFTGWQLANNSLYIYDQVKIDSNSFSTPEARELNGLAGLYFNHVRSEAYRKNLENYVGNFFIRQPEAPLKYYYFLKFRPTDKLGNIKNWARASMVFESFGKPIILRHPLGYIRYFVWPNLFNYLIPPLSHLERYNYGGNNIDPIAQSWFHYPEAKVRCASHNLQSLLLVYQAFFLLINIFCAWQFVQYLRLINRVKIEDNRHGLIWLMTSFTFFNFVFSLVSTVNILRYQDIPMVVLLALSMVIGDFIYEYGKISDASSRPVGKSHNSPELLLPEIKL